MNANENQLPEDGKGNGNGDYISRSLSTHLIVSTNTSLTIPSITQASK